MRQFFLIVLSILVFSNCSKKEMDMQFDENNVPKNVLIMNTPEDLSNLLSTTASMSPNQRKEWEKSKGFKSFGQICDEFYQTIDPESFKSLEEVKAFVAKNSRYLTLINDGNEDYTLEVAMYNNPYRYLINEEGFYIVQDKLTKVLDGYLIVSDIEDYAEMRLIDSKNISSYENQSIVFPTSQTSEIILKDAQKENCPNLMIRKDEGRERLRIELTAKQFNNGTGHFIVEGFYQIRPYRYTWPAWYRVDGRHIHADVKYAIDYTILGTEERKHINHSYVNHYASQITHGHYFAFFPVGQYPDHENLKVHFGGYDIRGRIPAFDGVYLEKSCRTEVLQ